MFALDTNTLIYYFRGDGRVGEYLLATSPRKIAVSSIVVHEIETGLAKSNNPRKRKTQWEQMLASITVHNIDRETAQTGAKIRAALETAGTPIGPLDTLIAASAVQHRATLVTRNLREFERVKGLAVVNWYD